MTHPGSLALDYNWSDSSDKSASTGKIELTRCVSQNYLIRRSRLPSSFLTRTKGSLLETTTIGFVTCSKDDIMPLFILMITSFHPHDYLYSSSQFPLFILTITWPPSGMLSSSSALEYPVLSLFTDIASCSNLFLLFGMNVCF